MIVRVQEAATNIPNLAENAVPVVTENLTRLPSHLVTLQVQTDQDVVQHQKIVIQNQNIDDQNQENVLKDLVPILEQRNIMTKNQINIGKDQVQVVPRPVQNIHTKKKIQTLEINLIQNKSLI